MIMAKTELEAKKGGVVDLKKTESIFDELDRLHRTISERAYDLFRNGGTFGGPLSDWLAAERELIAKPPIEVRQKDGQFEIEAALPGIDARDLDVQVTPEDLLIKAETTREQKTDKGTVHVSEFSRGKVFRSVRLPEKIDPNTAKAEYKDGMLRVTAAIAKTSEAARKLQIQAA
jgi:HSP20 family molecular chaperone IbpA